mmetsp:Transcript_15907/g.23262  ORF Transcript_15907/g.23262 Transcript_15907/m.23262 type:complete len:253 (+) Transcript_15907:129-887(+)
MKFVHTLALICTIASPCNAFTMIPNNKIIAKTVESVQQSKYSTTQLAALLSMDLEKPLGIILEEVEENTAQGVKVEELSDAGSAYSSPFRDQLVGLKVAEVMGTDVTAMAFDDVMDCIINAPSPVNISFEVEDDGEDEDDAAGVVTFEVGTAIQIKVIQEGNPDKIIDAKVGDNLRKTLLDNKVELYRGLKKKLGNCGGGGQCTFCAVDLVEDESEGWQARMDYENQKIPKFPTARLACVNNIQGPATIRVQ